ISFRQQNHVEMIITDFATVTGGSHGLLEYAMAILTLECYPLDIPHLNLLNELAIGHIYSIRITRIVLSKKHKEIIGNNGYNYKNDCAEKQIATVRPTSASGIIPIASITGTLWAACPPWTIWVLIHI